MKTIIKKVKRFFTAIPRAVASHSFLACLAFFVLAASLGCIFFYIYIFSSQKVESLPPPKQSSLDKDSYAKVLRAWEEQEKKVVEADSKQYLNPFKR